MSNQCSRKGYGLFVLILVIILLFGLYLLFFSKDWVIIRNYGSAPDVAIIQDGDSGEKFKSAEDCMTKASYLAQMSQDGAWFICGRKCRQEGIVVICDEFKR